MACGLARVHLLVCGGRGYAAAVVPPSLVRPLRASQSPFPFALRLISIDPVSYTHLTLPTIYSV